MNSLFLIVLASTTVPDRVTVFPDRAQVVRTAALHCGARSKVTFTNIPPSAAGDSFRAQLSGGTVDGLRAELNEKAAEYSADAEALGKEVLALEHELENTVDALAAAETQLKTGRQYTELSGRQIAQELTTAKPDLKSWHLAFDASLRTSQAAAATIAEFNAKRRALMERLNELRRKQYELQLAQQKRAWTVEVLATCPEGKTADLALSYLVGGASWTPIYEARADESHGSVDFSTWATVRQSTGEDWSSVSLTLSTALPSQNATPPELQVLEVLATEKVPEKKVLVRRDEAIAHAETGYGSAVQKPSAMEVSDQGLSVQLQVPEAAAVKGDGTSAKLFVGKSKMKANFELKAYPKLQPVAFRVAQLTNQAPWPLLPGRVDAFRSTGLVGRYQLERVPQGGAFRLTFGVEDAIRIKRTVVEELNRDTGLFEGNKRFRYAYAFEIANYGESTVEVVLADHLPVSELSDIKVSLGEKTTAGYQLAASDGVVSWKLPLKAQEKRKVDFNFQVDIPNSYETGGL